MVEPSRKMSKSRERKERNLVLWWEKRKAAISEMKEGATERTEWAEAVSLQSAVSEVHSSSCNLYPLLTQLSLSHTHAKTHILKHGNAQERLTCDSPGFHLALCLHTLESVHLFLWESHDIRFCMCGEAPPRVCFCPKPALFLQEESNCFEIDLDNSQLYQINWNITEKYIYFIKSNQFTYQKSTIAAD